MADAIYAARNAGFEAVECHWPEAKDISQMKTALSETGLPLLSLNTNRGNFNNGDFGLSALSGREAEAKDAIDTALDHAIALDCQNIHVMAGKSDHNIEAQECFEQNLIYACKASQKHKKTILIEPINIKDAPGYFLSTLDHALKTVESVKMSNLKVMFDCYHIATTHGDVFSRFKQAQHHIGHIQFASVPDRAEPDVGSVDYVSLLKKISNYGWTGYFGAEYKPTTTTEAGLGWMKEFYNA